MRKKHPLIETLTVIGGNQRACVLTEPLWDIPYSLYAPYMPLYMAALGLGDAQIGAVASIGLGLQFVWALLSGAITDKLGRRVTTFVFDVISWSIPLALWAVARGYWHFLLAAFFNAIWRVTSNSWSGLLVEDGDARHLVRIYTLVDITTFVAGMLSPAVGLFIDRHTLVPTMRVILWIACAMMTLKFVLLFFLSRETSVGRRRMAETRGEPLHAVFVGGFSVLRRLIRSPETVLSMAFLALMTCFSTVQASFWPLFISEKYRVSDALMTVFPMIKAIIVMAVYFTVTPRIRPERVGRPALWGLGAHALWIALLLLLMPLQKAGLPAVYAAVIIEAVASGILGPLGSTLLAIHADASERARVYSFAYAAILLVSTPAGWIAGQLSRWDRSLAMGLCMLLVIALAAAVALLARRQAVRGQDPGGEPPGA